MKALSKTLIIFNFALVLSFTVALKAKAESPPEKWLMTMTLKHEFKSYELDLSEHPDFFYQKTEYFHNGERLILPEENYCTEAELDPEKKEAQGRDLPEGVEARQTWQIDTEAIERYLESELAPIWNQESSPVTINFEATEAADLSSSGNENTETLAESSTVDAVKEADLAADLATAEDQIAEVKAIEITSPSTEGHYQSTQGKVAIEGTVIEAAERVVVDGYPLSQFQSGDQTWLYNIDANLNNRRSAVITAEAFDGDNQLLGTDKIYLEFTDLGPAANHDQILAELEQEPKNSQEKAIPSPSTEAGDTEVTTPQSITVPKGKISFDGVGKFGERLNIHTSAKLIETAIINELSYVTLSVDKENPQLEVAPELQNAGIKELLAVGESDFSGSPVNRVFNINKGADTFNGIIVGPGEEFSFNDILGPVNGATGYRQELVILGEQTIPDYGGGLCQVSTTAFRAAMLSGVEITERWAHAYAVSYYQPWGSDATIYIGGKNFRFKNDTTGALLIQTHIEDDKLYFHFYGSPDDRQVALYGPYVGRFRGAPAARTKYVDNLAPGARKVVSGSHNGFDATWYRLVRDDGESKLKEIFSRFQARGVIVLVGRSAESAPAAEGGSGEAEAVGG